MEWVLGAALAWVLLLLPVGLLLGRRLRRGDQRDEAARRPPVVAEVLPAGVPADEPAEVPADEPAAGRTDGPAAPAPAPAPRDGGA